MTTGQSILRQLCPEPCEPSEVEQVLLSDLDVSELRDLIRREILTPGPPKIASWTLFAALPVSGCFRWNDDFQTLPVPQDAPQPKFLWPIIHSFCNSASLGAPMGW